MLLAQFTIGKNKNMNGLISKAKNIISNPDKLKAAGSSAAGLGKFVVGGAALGAIGNTASHYFDESWTASSSGPQSFMAGAGWGAAGGAALGVIGSKGRYANNLLSRMKIGKIGHAQEDMSIRAKTINEINKMRKVDGRDPLDVKK